MKRNIKGKLQPFFLEKKYPITLSLKKHILIQDIPLLFKRNLMYSEKKL